MSRARQIRRAVTGRTAKTAAVALAAAAIGGGIVAATEGGGGSSSAPPVATAAAPTVATPSTAASLVSGGLTATDFSQIYARRQAGVVSITSTVPSSTVQPGVPGNSTATGSGVVIDTKGHILTNDHVIAGATRVMVEFSSGKTVKASLVGTDPSTDVALLTVSVPASQLSPIPIGDSSKIRIGDPVMAIGNPFGYQGSASAGIVSGLNRSIEAPNGFTITNAIQTDAAVNHGNSGGALVDLNGDLVGITTTVVRGTQDGLQVEGVAFAISSHTFQPIVDEIIRTGKVQRPYIGIVHQEITQALARQNNLSVQNGAAVLDVTAGSPADKAGIRRGDIITKMGGTDITEDQPYLNVLLQQRSGTTVPVTFVRNGREMSADVAITTR